MTLREVWDVTQQPILLDTGHGTEYIGSKILLQYGKRNVERIYVSPSQERLVITLEDEEDD